MVKANRFFQEASVKITMLCVIFLGISAEAYAAWDTKNCQKPSATDPYLLSNEMPWEQSLEQMTALYERIYQSPSRLFKRAYYDAAKKKYYVDTQYPEGAHAEIPEAFLKNVIAHAEEALKHKFANFIFFPDMGHTHFYVPLADWEKLKDLSPEESAKLYEGFFRSSGLRMMYHTAEQLKIKEGPRENAALPKDQFLLWRYFTRNLFGRNNGSRDIMTLFAWDNENYNTYRADLEGYFYFSAGFNISANKNGCFPFVVDGKTQYFDISLHDLPSAPSSDNRSF